jgi:SAM-dependent methyltransferase
MSDPIARAAHDDWDRHWESYTEAAEENPAQRYRHRLACELLQQNGCRGGAKILDIGSGQGHLASELRACFPEAEVVGLELSASGVAIAQTKAPSARFFQRDLLAPVDAQDPLLGWAEFAVCMEVLEHLDDPQRFLENARQLLSPGCVLIVSVPGGPMSEFDRHIGHRRHYHPPDLQALIERAGFRVRLATGAGFPFFNLYRLAVIVRGRRLIDDVATKPGVKPGLLARSVMAVFRPLFALNVFGTRLGWQTVGVAEAIRDPRPPTGK